MARRILTKDTAMEQRVWRFNAIVACKAALLEIEQFHSTAYPDCDEDCPAKETISRLRAIIGKEIHPEAITLQEVEFRGMYVDAPRKNMQLYIHYTGVGWYSLAHNGEYCPGEFPTTSRIRIMPL